MNHLEQLTAEWYEFRGYFVRRNVQVGRREKGGYEGELDVVAFCPQRNHLVHVEPSMDSNTWPVRETHYAKKFDAGRKYILGLFKGISLPANIEQIALLGFGSKANVKTIAGGRIMTSADLFWRRSRLRSARCASPQLLFQSSTRCCALSSLRISIAMPGLAVSGVARRP